MTPTTAENEVGFATVEIGGEPVRVRTTPPPLRRRSPSPMATLAPAGRRTSRPLPPEVTYTPVEVNREQTELGARMSMLLPGFSAVVAVAVLVAGFVAILVAG